MSKVIRIDETDFLIPFVLNNLPCTFHLALNLYNLIKKLKFYRKRTFVNEAFVKKFLGKINCLYFTKNKEILSSRLNKLKVNIYKSTTISYENLKRRLYFTA